MGSLGPSAVVFAYHNIGVRCLKVLLARGVHIPLVITHEDSPSETIWFDSVADTCREHSIPFITPTNPKSPDLLSQVQALRPEFIFSFYYRYILPTNILQQARHGAYNMHGSLLPKYRGRVPVNWAVLHGETETGMTLHEMTAKPDAGAIVAQIAVPILPDDTAFEVFGKLSVAAENLLWDILPRMLEDGDAIPRFTNDISRGSYFGGRKPEDGRIDWSRPAQEVYNLHRAVAPPYPGAWTELPCGKRLTIGKARLSTREPCSLEPGLSVLDGGIVGIGGDGRMIVIHQLLDSDQQLVSAYSLARKLALQNTHVLCAAPSIPTKHLLILGVNGFIGHHLLKRVLETTTWRVTGMDLDNHRISSLINHQAYRSRLVFKQGDMTAHASWIDDQIKNHCDIVLPLAAIATPRTYVEEPLSVFELDFEANLAVVRQTAKHGKRLIFPSTSEVYGMCGDGDFNPDTSDLVCGPIHKTRWMYSSSKQLMDRVIWAYGMANNKHPLDFTLFRPFNWIGTGLDSLRHSTSVTSKNCDDKTSSSSRVTTQFLGQILDGGEITLVNGGAQKRSFTHVNDGIDSLMKIIENKDNVTTGKIYNIGNPQNNCSIRELANLMLSTASEFPEFTDASSRTRIIERDGAEYYGEGYQDVGRRVPNIDQTCEDLGWRPEVSLEEAVRELFDGLSR